MTLNTKDGEMKLKKKGKSYEYWMRNVDNLRVGDLKFELIFKSEKVEIEFIDFVMYPIEEMMDERRFGTADVSWSWGSSRIGGLSMTDEFKCGNVNKENANIHKYKHVLLMNQ